MHDPGVVLVEAFAYLTDVLLYRLNRVPDRLYATFLNLIGTTVGPPGAALDVLLRRFRGERLGRPGAGLETDHRTHRAASADATGSSQREGLMRKA